MAQKQSTIINTNLFVRRAEDKTFAEAIKEYFKVYGAGFALLYSPRAVYLAKLESENHFVASSGKETAPVNLIEKDCQNVFEARVFNDTAELRWLNEADGKGAVAVLCKDDSIEFFGEKPELFKIGSDGTKKYLVGGLKQAYLLWGESVGASDGNGWTKFAEPRIGFFFVPVDGVAGSAKCRAQFIAIEYLGEYEDGNVAVAEERLTGIEVYKETE